MSSLRLQNILSLILLFLLSSQTSSAQDSTKNLPIRWGGFIDTQYAYDFNNPPNGDRSYSTQPSRSNEFNVNLAYLEARIDELKIRSRLALQAGTSVQSNYASEPNRGSVSGPSLSRHIQEARVGYQIANNTWIDAGIFFSNVGAETWISRDNLVLTRSLVADYSPYYLSGAKLTHVYSDRLTLQILAVNGWQIISENNTQKTLGTGIEYNSNHWIFSYNTLFGSEISPQINSTNRPSLFRHYHNLILKTKNLSRWECVGEFDIGLQEKAETTGSSFWSGASLMGRYALNYTQKIAIRAEWFQDRDQVVLVTNTQNVFNGTGASIGFDQSLEHSLLWRTEARYLRTTQPVFPMQRDLASHNLTTTTSLSLSF